MFKRYLIGILFASLLLFASGGISEEEPEPVETAETEEVVPAEPMDEPEAIVAKDEDEAMPGIEEPKPKRPARPVSVYVVPVQEGIGKPILYIVRRGLKEAIENDIDTVVLDIKTPGGRLDVTLELMQMLERFEGDTIAYVNDEAISAGAYISMATDDIYFAPYGVIGAAAVVSGSGEDIDETMKLKINSYLRAKVRSMTDEYRYRSDVLRAMMDADFVFKVEGEVLKDEDELLSLTANEAMKEYGDPPEPLLGAGIAETVEELLDHKYGSGNHVIKKFEVTWSELLAQYMETISPVLLGIGFLLLMIEFKTPGFGLPGISGIVMLLIVFASNYVAGLAGNEALIVFFVGIVFIGLELFVLPGTIFFGLLGMLMLFGSLLWSLADIWPDDFKDTGEGIPFDPAVLWGPVYDITFGLVIALVGFALLWRYLPKTSIWDKLVLHGATADVDPVIAKGGAITGSGGKLPEIGCLGKAMTDLHPLGEIEIDGIRFQATSPLDVIEIGENVRVTGYKNFALQVEKEKG